MVILFIINIVFLLSSILHFATMGRQNTMIDVIWGVAFLTNLAAIIKYLYITLGT